MVKNQPKMEPKSADQGESLFVRGPEVRLPNDLLANNLRTFLDTRATTLERHGFTRSEADQQYLQTFLTNKFFERNKRADEVASPEITEWVNRLEALFPYKTFGSFCVDGRVMPSVVFGFPGGFGGFLRLPAGNITDFTQGKQNELVLRKGTHFSSLLDTYFGKYHGVRGAQILDSHLGCAARRGKEELKRPSAKPIDSGLLEDVRHKKKIAAAMIQYAERYHADDTLLPIQFSYDPQTAFGYMGLETDKALEQAQTLIDDNPEVREAEFASSVLGQLAQEGIIISTEALAVELEPIFNDHYFDIDWASKYTQSVNKFWTAMFAMIEDTNGPLSFIKGKLVAVYGHEMPDEELQQRALLLLSNAFNGYLQRRSGVVKHTHEEQSVVVQRQGHGPFTIDAFSVYPDAEMAENIVFTRGLVIDNRKKKKIKDWTGAYGDDKDKFIDAPVPASIKYVVEEELTDDQWHQLHQLDWEKPVPLPQYGNLTLLDSWHTMNDDDFRRAIEKLAPNIASPLVSGLVALREKILRLYENSTTNELVTHGNIEALPLLVTKNREIKYIPLLVHQGDAEDDICPEAA